MTKHEYICQIADVVRAKSDCFKRKVGAVFVNTDYEILATGYNAPPRGFEHCDHQASFFSKDLQDQPTSGTCGSPCSRTIHAEQNGIVQAAKRGTALERSILYCTYIPCVNCSRLLINLKIKEVFAKEYNSDGGLEVLMKAGIQVFKWDLAPYMQNISWASIGVEP